MGNLCSRRMTYVDSIDFNGENDLIRAVKNKNFPACQMLVEHWKVDVNYANTGKSYYEAYNQTALMWACNRNSLDIVKLLVENGAEINYVSTVDGSPLREAVKNKNVEMVEYLIEHGADVNIGQGRYEYYGIENPLNMAMRSTDLSKILLSNGAQTFCKDRLGFVHGLVGEAVKYNPDIEMIMLYLSYGADINLGDHVETPLLMSLCWKKPEVATFLIRNGADVNIVDGNGSSPLMRAIIMGYLEVAKMLIELDYMDTEIADVDGDTALTIAAKFYEYDLVALLIRKASYRNLRKLMYIIKNEQTDNKDVYSLYFQALMKLYTDVNDMETSSKMEETRRVTMLTFNRVHAEMNDKNLIFELSRNERKYHAYQKLICRKCCIMAKKKWCTC